MLSAPVRGADCRYLTSLVGLKKSAVISIFLAYHSYRRTGIKQRSHFARLRVVETDRTPVLNYVS